MKKPCSHCLASRSRGFSIIEIMVGMVIALIATLIIFQMYAAFEGQKRSTTSGADATENGMLALYSIDRDARMAGTGLADADLLSCTSMYSYYSDGTTGTSPAPAFAGGLNSLMAAFITNGAGGLSDTITFNYGDSIRSGISTAISKTMPPTSSELNVVSTAGYAEGDVVIIVQNGQCTVMEITQVQPSAYKLQHNPSQNDATYNAPSNFDTSTWPTYTAGAQLFSLGGGTTSRTYFVGASGNTFALMSLLPTDAAAIATVGDIVNLQVQYGIAPVGSQAVNCWVNATTGNACDTSDWANPSTANIQRIKAIRVAVVARSAQIEKPTGGACTTTAAAPVSWTGGPAIDLTADLNWQCYRYKVFQTITPFRNVLWANL